MACLPGMPCFGNHPNNPSPITCGVDPCFTYKTTTDLAHYVGPNLPCIDVNTCETLTTIIQKIDYALCGENLAKTFIDTLLTNSTLYNLFCTQIVQNCITCDYMKECIDCDYITGCIPPCPPCPTTSTTSTTTTETPCYCYQVDVSSGTIYNVSWYDCESGSIQSTNVSNETFRMCAQKNSVYFSLVSGTGAFSLSGGTTLCSMNSDCYEEFIMDAEDVTDLLIARIDFTQFASAFRPLIVDWGDGSETIYTTAGSNTNIAHTYSSPYTGPVKIRIADLTKITVLHLIEVFGTGVQPTAKSLIITGTQITKLNGLTSLFCTLATLNCTTSQLPRTLITLNSVLGNLSGNITGLPTNIQTLSLGTHGVGGTVYPNGNTLSGNVVDFKGTLRSIAVYGTNTLTGDINTMPTNVKNLSTSFQVAGSNTITGDLETTFNSNTVMTNFTLLGNNTVYGDLDGNGIVPAFASTNMVTFQITGMSYPSGTTSGAFGHMSNLKTLVLEFDENMPLPWPTNIGTSLTGSVFSLPNTINFLLLAGANTVSGDIIDIPSGVYVGETSYINIRGIATGWQPGGGNTINGLVDDIPTNCRFFTISGKNTIGGDIANIPAVSNLVTVRIGSSFQTVFGNLWDLPAQIKVFELTSGTGVITYVPPVPYPSITVSKTWATGFNRIWIKPASSVLSVNDMDQLLIDIADVTWANSSSFPVKDFWVYGTGPSYRSAISDTAYNNLIAQGVTIQYS